MYILLPPICVLSPLIFVPFQMKEERLPLLQSNSKVKYYTNDKISWRLRRKRKRELEEYYANLKHLEELYENDYRTMVGNESGKEIEQGPDRLLARLAVGLNLILLFTNLLAAVLSNSLSILSAFVDSFMDVTSGAIIGVCLWLINNTNSFNYPRGRQRLELVGVIICSIIMGIANMAIIMQSVTAILTGDISPEMSLITFSILLGGAAIKVILMIVCYKRGTSSSKVLAMDMRNDIATSLVAIVAATIGHRVWPYADPVGAILVCGAIAVSWFGHAMEHVPQLVGVRAEQEDISRILKIVIEHDERIKFIDHIMVYHTGPTALVEVHIVMDENLTLRVTHDISHPLEKKLMLLDFVERAFVHCDYDCDGD